MKNSDVKRLNNLYYYKTNDFAYMTIKHYFTYEGNKRNYIICSLLCSYLKKCNAKIGDCQSIERTSRSLYSTSVHVGHRVDGNKFFFTTSLIMVDPKVIGEDYMDKSLYFYKDMITKPLFNPFDDELLEHIKKVKINRKDMNLNDTDYLQMEMMKKRCILRDCKNEIIITDINEYKEIINSITKEDLIEFYYNLMNNFVTSYAFGNFTDEDIVKISSLFDYSKVNFDYNYRTNAKLIKNDIVMDDNRTTQSYLYTLYKINTIDKIDKTIIYYYLNYLCNSSGLLHQILRDQMGIVYSTHAGIFTDDEVVFLQANIDKVNEKKALEGLKEVFNKMQTIKELKKSFEFNKEKMNEQYLRTMEDPKLLAEELSKVTLNNDMTRYELKQLIDNITFEEYCQPVKTLEHHCNFIYRGTK